MVIELLLLLAKQVLFRRLEYYFSLSQPGKQVLLLILQEQKFNNCFAFAFNKQKQ